MKNTAALIAMAIATLSATTASADTFIIVHGAFQNAASWNKVSDGLRAAGHTAIAVNLPGRTAERPLGQISMADHVAAVRTAIDSANGPVVLVGHSFGGMVISAVAEAAPAKISSLVYVAAYLPSNGQSMQAMAALDHHNGFAADTFQVATDYSSANINPRDGAKLFGSDARPRIANQIGAALIREPLQPMGTPLTLSTNFDGVRKAYVVTLKDRVVSLPMQLNMVGQARVAEVVPIEAGHSPQMVVPDVLVKALITASTSAVE